MRARLISLATASLAIATFASAQFNLVEVLLKISDQFAHMCVVGSKIFAAHVYLGLDDGHGRSRLRVS